MAQKLKGYGFIMILTVVVTLAGIVSMLPNSNASKECLLSYKAVCSFAPISAVICFGIAGVLCVIRKRRLIVKG